MCVRCGCMMEMWLVCVASVHRSTSFKKKNGIFKKKKLHAVTDIATSTLEAIIIIIKACVAIVMVMCSMMDGERVCRVSAVVEQGGELFAAVTTYLLTDIIFLSSLVCMKHGASQHIPSLSLSSCTTATIANERGQYCAGALCARCASTVRSSTNSTDPRYGRHLPAPPLTGLSPLHVRRRSDGGILLYPIMFLSTLLGIPHFVIFPFLFFALDAHRAGLIYPSWCVPSFDSITHTTGEQRERKRANHDLTPACPAIICVG